MYIQILTGCLFNRDRILNLYKKHKLLIYNKNNCFMFSLQLLFTLTNRSKRLTFPQQFQNCGILF